ncbi:hypothetical protein BGW80DRAFT_1281931 [Lactifluus volemus]|nr:hypothetical protein BGW80DRAFT_1281931 [Lactifluus volemus]
MRRLGPPHSVPPLTSPLATTAAAVPLLSRRYSLAASLAVAVLIRPPLSHAALRHCHCGTTPAAPPPCHPSTVCESPWLGHTALWVGQGRANLDPIFLHY